MSSDCVNFPEIKGVLFGLDGILIDSTGSIVYAINKLLDTDWHAAITIEEARSMMGGGIQKLVERAFNIRGKSLSVNELNARTKQMMRVFQQYLTVETTKMRGAAELLSFLAGRGYKLGVVTNLPMAYARQLIVHFGWEQYIDAVVGGDSLPALKPRPTLLNKACRYIQLDADQCMMVGNSRTDIDAAIGARMASVAVRSSCGKTSVDDLNADLVCDDLIELFGLFNSKAELYKNTDLRLNSKVKSS